MKMRINSQTVITGSKIILFPYKAKHVQKYHIWMQDKELQYLTASEPLTLQEEYEMQKSWLEDEKKCTFIVLDKEKFENSNEEIESMIGDVNLYFNNSDAAEIEVMIADAKHRSKGKGREALLFMLRYGVETLKAKKFVAKIKMDNHASLKLFESIGFSQTSTSDFFKEIEMTRPATEDWIDLLISITKFYEMENKPDL